MCPTSSTRGSRRTSGPARKRTPTALGSLACLLLLAQSACSQSSRIRPLEEVPISEMTFTFDRKDASFARFPDHRLMPGDVLEVLYHLRTTRTNEFQVAIDNQVTVRFVDIPELNETQRVRPDGTISLPYLGVVPVAGMTVDGITRDLEGRYAAIARQPFRIGVDDQVGVKFVAVPELSEMQTVRPDGTISLPYLGVVAAAGKTVAEFTAELKAAYKGILNDPELYVVDTQPASVWVEVRKKLQEPKIHVVVEGFRDALQEFKNDLRTTQRGLGRLVTIRSDGYATFPLLGDLKAADRTIPDLAGVLNERYGEVMPDARVDLALQESPGSRIFVLGNVKSPGAYPIQQPTPVIKALALAGSFLPGSSVEDILVFRRHEERVVATKIDMDAVLRLKPGAAYFYLRPDDVLYVPRSGLSLTAEAMREVANIIFFRGITIDPVDPFFNNNH